MRAYGPGIEPTGPIVGAPANFTVETFSAGKGNVDVIVDDSKGNKLPVRINFLQSIVNDKEMLKEWLKESFYHKYKY